MKFGGFNAFTVGYLQDEQINRTYQHYLQVTEDIEKLKAHPFTPGKPYPGTGIHDS